MRVRSDTFGEPFIQKILQNQPSSLIIGVLRRFALQISIGWLYVVTSVIPLALKGILPIRIIAIGKIL